MDAFKTILEALATAIEEKNTTIMVQKWEIEGLRKQLAETEKHISELEAKNAGVLCNRGIERRKDDNG